ncbi:hypothetical protein TrCOL_g6128 [Triparma columacea]|uniref:SET domain-containing protein n=1 Tax=Triparma columacea TaxID=722753 RepID=A0A9W7L819_9STRA|nr:hypothetical protein TrCOL_g6128 [Triparma columacea]
MSVVPTLSPLPSTIPNSGLGLFLTSASGGSIPSGSLVCNYTGSIVTTKEVATLPKYKDRLDGGYLLRIGHSPSLNCIAWLDGEDVDAGGMGRYINDPLNDLAYNVEFVKLPTEDPPRVEIRATRKIYAGEELFVSYGKGYWMKRKGRRVGVKELGELYWRVKQMGGEVEGTRGEIAEAWGRGNQGGAQA